MVEGKEKEGGRIMDNEKKGFIFYHSWWYNMRKMTPEMKLRMVENLINYSEGNPLIEQTDWEESLLETWKISIDMNRSKWDKRASVSKENGSKGGRPPENQRERKGIPKMENNPQKPTGLFNNLDEPRKPVKSKKLIVNGKKLMVNCEMVKVDGKEVKVESDLSIGNSDWKIVNGEVLNGDWEIVLMNINYETISINSEMEFKNIAGKVEISYVNNLTDEENETQLKFLTIPKRRTVGEQFNIVKNILQHQFKEWESYINKPGGQDQLIRDLNKMSNESPVGEDMDDETIRQIKLLFKLNAL